MPRLFLPSIAVLPFALCAMAAAAAQEAAPPPERPQRMPAPAQHAEPRHMPQQRPEADLARRAERRMPAEQSMPPPQPAQPQPDRRSISNAVRQVRRSTGGQILGAEQVPYEGRNITRVKYMDDRGRVRYMDMDESGSAERRSPRRTNNDEP